MKKILLSVLLAVIVLAAFVLRTYKVTSIPPSLSWDEVSIGYNAYSILKTGKDEHGKFLPVDAFIAYGDYKPPLAVYATVPFIAVFGLNELSVRLPSAVAGTLTVLLTYYLVVELFRVFATKQKKEEMSSLLDWLPITSAVLLAFSPWHINLSRAGFEANIALFLIVLGIYFVLKAITNHGYWYVCWLPFIATIYTFNSSRYFAPMFGLVLVVFFWKHMWRNKKAVIVGMILSIALIFPIIPHLLSKEARLRFNEVNIFTDLSVIETSNNRIEYDHNSIIAKIFHNRRLGYVFSFLRHYTDNLQPSFLFMRGDGNPKFSIQDVGQLYMIEAPFLFIGLLSLFSVYPAIGWFLLFWLALAIVPAATARETPHALRILNSMPTWQIFISFGLCSIVGWVKRQGQNRNLPKLVERGTYIVITAVYLFSVMYYLHYYYSHYPKLYSGEWQYGYREGIRYAQSVIDRYDTVYISETIGRPYMYTLFYTKYDPAEFRSVKDASFDAAGFYHVYGFGKYRFIKTMTPETSKSKSLYIVDPGWVPKGAHILKVIDTLDGYHQLVVFDT